MFRPYLLGVLSALTLVLVPQFPAYKNIVLAQSTPAAGSAERERGIALYRQGRHSQAVTALKTAVKKDKSDYQAWRVLGLAQIQIDDLKGAAKSMQNVVKLKPDLAAGHIGLSYTSLLRSKLPEAMREARLVLDLDPNLPEAHYLIGVISIRTGNKEEALKEAEATIKLDPKFSAAYLLKSQALASFLGYALISDAKETTEERRAGYLEAAAALEKYLELEPNAEDRQTWLAQIESLRFYSVSHLEDAGPDRIYSGKQVTAKARVTGKPEPVYTEAARRRGITGTVVLRCIFAADGTVKHFLIISALPYGLTEQAIAAAQRIKFIPAMLDAKPVSMFIQLEYNFNLY